METIFKEDEEVRSKVNPALNLVVGRYVGKIYYCMIMDEPTHKELAYSK